MVADCLARQTHQDWEWLISVPAAKRASFTLSDPRAKVFDDPPAHLGDFYSLNKAWNQLVSAATSEVLVFAVDWIYFAADTLERFLAEWADGVRIGLDGKVAICAANHHYRKKPDGGIGRPRIWWHGDPRLVELDRAGDTSNQMPAEWLELSLAMLPRQAVIDAGGFDEDFDKGAGCSEQDLALRMAQQGCCFFLNGEIECRNWTHPKISTKEEWDAAYAVASDMLWAKKQKYGAPNIPSLPRLPETLAITKG